MPWVKGAGVRDSFLPASNIALAAAGGLCPVVISIQEIEAILYQIKMCYNSNPNAILPDVIGKVVNEECRET